MLFELAATVGISAALAQLLPLPNRPAVRWTAQTPRKVELGGLIGLVGAVSVVLASLSRIQNIRMCICTYT